MKTQRHNTIKTVIVLGRIYGLSHLLSSERLLNIYQTAGNVKNIFPIIIKKKSNTGPADETGGRGGKTAP